MTAAPDPSIRVDKWLWFARFFKTRSMAAKTVSAGRVRVNSVKVSKPAHTIGPGDVLTFAQGRGVRVVRLIETGTRRGPATDAQRLYEDLTPDPQTLQDGPQHAPRSRPARRERRKPRFSRNLPLE